MPPRCKDTGCPFGCPLGPPNLSRSRCHPSTLQEDPGGAATVNPCPCQLPPSTHTGVTGPAPDADPDAERAQASRERSSSPFFSCFPLKTKRADASLGRFLSQEHSPKTSAPGPALTDLTLCGPGGAEGPGVPARGGGAGGAGTHRGCRAPRHSLTRGLTIDGPAAVPGTGGVNPWAARVSRPRDCPSRVPHAGGDRHPPGISHPAGGWERGAGGGPRFPAQPLLPRDRSLRTSEGAQTPAPACPPPGHPAGHRPGEAGRWARGARPPRAARSCQPAANRPSPPPQTLPASIALPPPSSPAPRDPLGDRQLGTPPQPGGDSTPNHAPPLPARMSRVAPAP